MAWECQRSPYARQFESKVISCTPSKLEDKDGFDVLLEDTILFPAGGGQVINECSYRLQPSPHTSNIFLLTQSLIDMI